MANIRTHKINVVVEGLGEVYTMRASQRDRQYCTCSSDGKG